MRKQTTVIVLRNMYTCILPMIDNLTYKMSLQTNCFLVFDVENWQSFEAFITGKAVKLQYAKAMIDLSYYVDVLYLHDFVCYTGYPPMHGIQHHHQLVPQHVSQPQPLATLQSQNPLSHLMHAAAGN